MLGKGILDQLLCFAVLQPCGVEVSLAGQKTEIRFRMIFLIYAYVFLIFLVVLRDKQHFSYQIVNVDQLVWLKNQFPPLACRAYVLIQKYKETS